MTWFNLALHRSKVQLAAPTKIFMEFRMAVLTPKLGIEEKMIIILKGFVKQPDIQQSPAFPSFLFSSLTAI